MDEGMENIENVEIPAEGAPEPPVDNPPDDTPDVPEDIPAEDGADPAPSDQDDPVDIEKRIDDLLDQIGAGQDYGSMGDYYIADAGCYAFPTEEVFFHFIGEAERADWTTASNGCYVPVGSLETYEAYLSSGSPQEGEGEQLPPPVTQEDLSGLEETLQVIREQDAVFHEAAVLHMEATDQVLSDMQHQLYKFEIFLFVIGFFVAFLCGVKLADIFWNRMRAG